MTHRCAAVALAIAMAGATGLSGAEPITIFVDQGVAPARFAVDEIAASLRARALDVQVADLADLATATAGRRIVLGTVSDPRLASLLSASPVPDLIAEGFGIRITRSELARTILVAGADPGGAMYGGLELAEQLRLRGWDAVTPMERRPHFAMRGMKFNAPLDLRTPSYTDMSAAAQANIAEVWSFDFWKDQLDALARHRYNFVSLWNLHPFPSLVQVPEYPDVALADVQRSTIKFVEDYPLSGEGLVTPAMLEQVETVRTMSIAEKIDFWRRVMEYGRDRNIDFYVVTWNIFTYGAEGKYDITDAIDNPTTVDYFRKSVAALFRTYPLLRGIGLTTGENMGTDSFEAKEAWAFATYGEGVLDAAREQPGRKIRFIHRQHQTRAQDIAHTFAPLIAHPDVDFVFSFKYAQAHVMSSTTQTFHRGFTDTLGDLKTIWTLRNDDALMFRWGAPDFVREFIRNIPAGVSQGMYYGSDQWIWGREFLSLAPETPRQLEIEKHWFNWMLWGRLSYDPELDNEHVVALLRTRFPGVDARALLEAWQHASMTYPLTTGFHWGEFDFQWYIEGCRSRPGPAQTDSGFHDVNRFITLAPHPGTDNLSIPENVAATLRGKEITGTPPESVAARLHEHAAAALTRLDAIDAGSDRELHDTLADIRAMAHLGHYYGYKIAGATALEFFRQTGNVAHQQKAVDELTRAAGAWTKYTTVAASIYRNPLWTNRVGFVDWTELRAEVARDVTIAREARGPAAP